MYWRFSENTHQDVTLFFTDYSLKTIFLKHGQKDCKYLSYDLSGLMSLQSNIFSRFWSIRIICPLFYGWVNQKIREKQWWFYGISGWLLNTYNVNRARSARWWSIGHLLVDLIKYWNFGIRAYTIFCKVSFLTGQIQNALSSSYCEFARNVGRCMYWQTIHELLCLLSASSLPRDTFTKRSLLWCSSFRVSRNKKYCKCHDFKPSYYSSAKGENTKLGTYFDLKQQTT